MPKQLWRIFAILSFLSFAVMIFEAMSGGDIFGWVHAAVGWAVAAMAQKGILD